MPRPVVRLQVAILLHDFRLCHDHQRSIIRCSIASLAASRPLGTERLPLSYGRA